MEWYNEQWVSTVAALISVLYLSKQIRRASEDNQKSIKTSLHQLSIPVLNNLISECMVLEVNIESLISSNHLTSTWSTEAGPEQNEFARRRMLFESSIEEVTVSCSNLRSQAENSILTPELITSLLIDIQEIDNQCDNFLKEYSRRVKPDKSIPEKLSIHREEFIQKTTILIKSLRRKLKDGYQPKL